MRIEFHDERAFERWLASLAPERAGRVVEKLVYVAEHDGSRIGMPLVRGLGHGLHELRVAGLRRYFTERDGAITVLAAGRKDTQQLDIARARRRLT